MQIRCPHCQNGVELVDDHYEAQLPGIDLTSFPDDVQKIFIARSTATMCPCGCEFNLTDCRIKDSNCGVSLKLLNDLAGQLKEKKITTADAAANAIDTFFKDRLAEQK